MSFGPRLQWSRGEEWDACHVGAPDCGGVYGPTSQPEVLCLLRWTHVETRLGSSSKPLHSPLWVCPEKTICRVHCGVHLLLVVVFFFFYPPPLSMDSST